MLPPDVKIHPFYDRTDLIHLTTHTVEHNLLLGVLLVTLILVLFLRSVRTGLIVAATIPLALATRVHPAQGAATSRSTCCRSARSTSASWSTPA